MCAVDGGYRGVIWDRFSGVQGKVYGEGTHFRIPFIQVRGRAASTRAHVPRSRLNHVIVPHNTNAGAPPAIPAHAARLCVATPRVSRVTVFGRFRLQYPTTFDVRLRPRVVSSRTGTKDMQMVNISLRVLARPMEEDLPIVFKDLGENWDDRVLPSIVNEVLKAVVAQHDAHQLLTQREDVSRMISEQLNERALDFHCILDGTPVPIAGRW